MRLLVNRSDDVLSGFPRLSKAMWKSQIDRASLSIVLAAFALFFLAVQAWCRLMLPPSMADVRTLAEKAPFVFRGHVLTVTPIATNTQPGAGVDPTDWRPHAGNVGRESVAKIQVDRWYRGNGSTEALLRFTYSGEIFANGHDCIDFRPETYSVVFAVEKDSQMEMIDDCEGALTISSLLGPKLAYEDWLAQMEIDFLAGLDDHDSEARLVSIQRLGGLRLPSSRDALHRVIENGDEAESKWAVYAALRTGDVTVLPWVQRLLVTGDGQLPERAIASELQNVSDPAAVPDLIAILESAPGELTRTRVLLALGEKLKDRRAVPSLAAHLSDPDQFARHDAMDGLKNITHEDACTLPREWKERDVEPQISRCKIWWEQAGKFRDWTRN
jgi:hypothetical protein